ncbi:MAG: DNA polymerase III subunit epsilon [Alphaproteobacteria bacterium]|nr:DNA polymerase III subunit epsilon [Alphaproteobacteria bacterium]
MREIVLDTETTGFKPSDGHRIVEIGCVELHNHVPTGGTFHKYINPERDMPTEAFQVHGLSMGFLSDQPVFSEVVGEFLEFVGDTKLVIHNAGFDMGFINAELKPLGFAAISMSQTIDTVRMARDKFPGAQANLDALCRRFNIDSSARTKHGALLDAELLAEVYLELMGGRQQGFGLADDDESGLSAAAPIERVARPPRPHEASDKELAAHREFLKRITEPVWEKG